MSFPFVSFFAVLSVQIFCLLFNCFLQKLLTFDDLSIFWTCFSSNICFVNISSSLLFFQSVKYFWKVEILNVSEIQFILFFPLALWFWCYNLKTEVWGHRCFPMVTLWEIYTFEFPIWVHDPFWVCVWDLCLDSLSHVFFICFICPSISFWADHSLNFFCPFERSFFAFLYVH